MTDTNLASDGPHIPHQMEVSDEVAIEIVGMNKWYGQFHVLRDIDLTVYRGERIVICGPSGSGKSTVVRCINRLEQHQSGTIRLHGKEVSDAAAIQGDVGMVFQQFNLFPHLSVLDNLTLGPMKARGLSQTEAIERAIDSGKRNTGQHLLAEFAPLLPSSAVISLRAKLDRAASTLNNTFFYFERNI